MEVGVLNIIMMAVYKTENNAFWRFDMKQTKNIKIPTYKTKFCFGHFFADDECPNCGMDTVYFDAGNGWYECSNCGWHSKRSY